jgi:hypothetical protein
VTRDLSELEQRVGLCARCHHARRVVSGKGSEFWLCELAGQDARLPKYPRLPVLRCPGWKAAERTPRP